MNVKLSEIENLKQIFFSLLLNVSGFHLGNIYFCNFFSARMKVWAFIRKKYAENLTDNSYSSNWIIKF